MQGMQQTSSESCEASCSKQIELSSARDRTRARAVGAVLSGRLPRRASRYALVFTASRAVLLLLMAACSSWAIPAAADAAGRCGEHPWCSTSLSPAVRAGMLLGAMTQQEKVSLLGGDELTGVIGGEHTHTGTQFGIPRLNVPAVLYSDGPVGPRQGKSAGLPIPLALAATFNPALAGEHGRVAASEAKAKGNDVIFGPAVNIARNPLSGRTYENYGEDPWLESQLVVPWIKAAQAQGVIADVKHFAANNQEGVDASAGTVSSQTPLGAGVEGSRLLQNDVIDERTFREIYLPQFEAAVRDAKVGTVMCSYNRINGQYACENQHLLQQILSKEWGFDGYVLADYLAAHNTLASINNGLDFEPFPPIAYQPLLIDGVLSSGLASTATMDGHVRAMLTTWFRFGLFDRASYRDDDAQIDKPADEQTAQQIEEQAITLLQNKDGALPLHAAKLKKIAISGAPATTFATGGGSGNITPFDFADPLAAIKQRAGAGVQVTYDASDAAAAAANAKNADVAIVFAGDYYTEGADRSCLSLECPMVHGNQDALIRAVAAANKKTIVVLASGGPDLTPWRKDVSGLVEAWFGGSRSGPALAKVLFGDIDPSGRLPVTFPDSDGQTPTAVSRDRYPGTATFDVHYDEGVLIGYRWYDHQKLTPAFPFGFGLSYTTSTLSGLKITPKGDGATVTATVRNTGSRKGYVVSQLYVGLPEPRPGVTQPPSQLKGMDKVLLGPGKARKLSFTLSRRDLSYWDTTSNAWQVAPGCVQVKLGLSSRDLPLTGTLPTGGTSCPGSTASMVCASRRSVRYTLPRGATWVRLTVAGKRRTVKVRGRMLTVAFKGLPKRPVNVLITARVRGKRYVRRSTVNPCTKRPA